MRASCGKLQCKCLPMREVVGGDLSDENITPCFKPNRFSKDFFPVSELHEHVRFSFDSLTWEKWEGSHFPGDSLVL